MSSELSKSNNWIFSQLNVARGFQLLNFTNNFTANIFITNAPAKRAEMRPKFARHAVPWRRKTYNIKRSRTLCGSSISFPCSSGRDKLLLIHFLHAHNACQHPSANSSAISTFGVLCQADSIFFLVIYLPQGLET